MIKNDKQLAITKKQLATFQQAHNTVRNDETREPILKQIEVDALASQIEEFTKDIKLYEDLKTGKVWELALHSLEQVGEACIKCRIAKGWSQADLAIRLGVAEQQIQRYESENYQSINYFRLMQIVKALDMKLDGKIQIGAPVFILPSGDVYSKIAVARERRTLISI